MVPVIVCTVGGKSIDVMEASFRAYAPETPLIIHRVERSTFGESYNKALAEAFKEYDEIIIANDDVIITPTTITKLLEDVSKLKAEVGDKIGFVATLADNVRVSQSIRYGFFGDQDQIERSKWRSEHFIKCVPVIAPIFAWMPKKAFETAQFPPVNWWSDDIICDDLTAAGFMHFISTAYVHHVGSATVGHDYEEQRKEAMPWLKVNRPHYVEEYGHRQGRPLE